jgi:luciferase family oxidoreductase group 1
MRISVLDQSPISEGSTGADALRHTIDLARLADRLGYHRYWVAEHHGTPMLACASPEVLIGPIGTSTTRIRVGSGGVMLPHYSPLKVAESFSMLSGLCPGRIDLAVGRAPGTDPTTMYALQRDRRQLQIDDFPEQLAELLGYIGGSLPPEHPFARLSTLPGAPEAPEPWLLGSSPQSAIWAAEVGLPYAFADFINPAGAAMARRYRQDFVPSPWRAAPEVIVAVWVVCAESTTRRRPRLDAVMSFRLPQRGQLIRVLTVERALVPQRGRQHGCGRLAGNAQPETSGRQSVRGAGGPRKGGGRVSGRRGDGRHDHTRPRGKTPFVRVDCARLRPGLRSRRLVFVVPG